MSPLPIITRLRALCPSATASGFVACARSGELLAFEIHPGDSVEAIAAAMLLIGCDPASVETFAGGDVGKAKMPPRDPRESGEHIKDIPLDPWFDGEDPALGSEHPGNGEPLMRWRHSGAPLPVPATSTRHGT